MKKLHQVIIRNTPQKGLDIIDTTLERSQVHDIYQFIPQKIPSTFNKVFLTKCQHSSGKISLLTAFDDGFDQYGRKSIKIHALIIDVAFYNAKTIQYFISPLMDGSMNVDEDKILESSDFNTMEPFPVSSKFVELVYCKKYVQMTSQELNNALDIIQIFGTIDRLIPPCLTQLFSFQTMVSLGHEKELRNKNLIFLTENKPNVYLIEDIQKKTSEFSSIQSIANAYSDLELLRRLQKELFIDNQERILKFKFHLRFGIKTISSIKKSLESEIVSKANLTNK